MSGKQRRSSSWFDPPSSAGGRAGEQSGRAMGDATAEHLKNAEWKRDSDEAIADGRGDLFAQGLTFFETTREAFNESDIGQAFNDLVGLDGSPDPNPYGPTEGVRTPDWVLKAQAYNQWRVEDRFDEVADWCLRAGGDHDAYKWSKIERRRFGRIGLAFSHLVASAQRAVNAEVQLAPDEKPMTVDGCFGPTTEDRVASRVGEKTARLGIALDEAEQEYQQDKVNRASSDAMKQASDVESIDDISDAGGGILDALLPRAGDKKSLEIALRCPMFGGVAKFGVFTKIEGERTDDDKFKIRCELGAELSGELDAWIATAWAKAKVWGYLEVQADSAEEIFDLVLLALHENVEDSSEDLAELIWGVGFESDVVENMDEKDYIEYGIGASVSGGVSWGSGSGLMSGEHDSGVSAEIEGTWGERITRGEDTPWGPMAKSESVKAFAARIGVELPGGWKGQLAFGTTRQGKASKGSVKVKGERTIDMMDFASQLSTEALQEQLIQYGARISGHVHDMITGSSDLDANTARQVGAAMDTIASGSFGIPVGVSAGIAELKDRYGRFGQEMSQILDIAVEWDDAGKVTLDVEMSSGETLKWGDSDDPIMVEYQALTRMFKIPTITLAAGKTGAPAKGGAISAAFAADAVKDVMG